MLLAVFVCVAVPPATSKDFNSYALYGRISAKYHQSPYTDPPRDFAADPWFQRTSGYWSDAPSVYGPAFTGISRVVMGVTGTSELKTRLAFQGLAALSLLAAVAMLSRRLGWALASAAVGLNPLLITFGVNDAHCDVLIGALVLAGTLSAARKWFVRAGVLLALAALIKISLLPAVFGAFVWFWFRGQRRGSVAAAVSAGVAMAIALLATGGLDSIQALHQASLRHTRFSVWNPAHIMLTDIFGSRLPTHSTADVVVSLVATLAVFAFGLFALWKFRNRATPALAITCIPIAYQVLGAYTLSWYAAWSIPALMAELRSDWRQVRKPLLLTMGHGCWLAVAYLSGYGVIVVSVVVGVVGVRKMVGQWK